MASTQFVVASAADFRTTRADVGGCRYRDRRGAFTVSSRLAMMLCPPLPLTPRRFGKPNVHGVTGVARRICIFPAHCLVVLGPVEIIPGIFARLPQGRKLADDLVFRPDTLARFDRTDVVSLV